MIFYQLANNGRLQTIFKEESEMALRINHNISSLDAWRNLTETTSKMSSSMEKLSSGYRINRAADDPAGLVISEQFRAQIAGLNRAVQNSEGSINMIQTAEGALNEINNLLVSMRQLAIHAANQGFNDTDQLAADQAEITNAISTISRISSNTQFGTKKLLDGSAANVAAITTSNSSRVTLSNSQLSAGVHSVTAVKLTESTATVDTTSFGLSTPSSPYNLSDGVHNLDVVQASAGAVKTGNAISALDAWGNGLSITATAASIRAAYVRSTTGMTTVANNVQHTITFQVNYQEAGSNPVGMQTVSIRTDAVASSALAANIISKLNDAINANSYLAGKVQATVTDAVGGADSIRIRTTGTGTQYSVAVGSVTATNASINTALSGLANQNDRGRSGNQISITAQFASSSTLVDAFSRTRTFAIGTGTFTTLSALAATINGKLTLDSIFGTYNDTSAGEAQKVYATVVSAGGQSYLKFYTSDEGSKFSLKVNETGGTATSLNTALGLTADTIANTGTDAIVRFDGFNNTINDVRYFYTAASYNESVSIYTSSDTESKGSVTFNRSMAKENGGILVGSMLLTVKARTFSVQLDGGTATVVTGGKDATVFNSQRDQSASVNFSLKSEGGTEQLFVTDRSLVFQIGANVGQTAKIGLDNLSADYLGRNLSNNQFSSLASIDVTSASGAQDSQKIIDRAITEVTNIRGKLGSFQRNTLESNLTNLRIASQNLTASESTIRDTDMAKEMSEFVRYQILMQAGTAMLAQGNQTPQSVLSLFQ
jgi:flagellin